MEESSTEQSAVPQGVGSSDVSKARLKKPVKPDVEEHKAAIEQLQQEMHKRRTKMEELKHLIDQKRLSGGGPEVSKARATLNDINQRFRAELVSDSRITYSIRQELDTCQNFAELWLSWGLERSSKCRQLIRFHLKAISADRAKQTALCFRAS